MNIDLIINTPYFQILLALILGAFVGIERNFAGKTAGMRTYGLVSMGACLFVIISNTVLNSSGLYSVDPLRLAAGVVTGIGFLGAGAIIFKESHISGLTTAAGLWVSSGIGLAVGYKLYNVAIFVVVLTLLVFTLFWFVEKGIVKSRNDGQAQ